MAASTTPKFMNYNQLVIAGPTLTHTVTEWEGQVSWTEAQPERLVAYNQNDFSAVVKGREQMIPITFTVNFTEFTHTEALVEALLDVFKRRETWAAEGGVSDGTFTNFADSDLKFTTPGLIFDEQADGEATFKGCIYISHGFASGAPNTLVFSLECYGGVEDTGQVIAP